MLTLSAGCGAPATPPAALKVYRHSEDGAPASVDPAQASTVHASTVVRSVYDTLYAYRYLARPYQIKPNLAAALPEVSPDGLSWIIRLKPGVRFIDDAAFAGGRGREVVADDVVYSLQRHFDPGSRSQGAWLWRGRIVGLDAWKAAGSDYARPVEGLRALDAHTVQLRLTRPYPQFLQTLTLAYAAVVPREAVARYGREFGRHPVGSGPFRLASLDSARAVLLRNEGFRREPLDLAEEGYVEARDRDLDLAPLQGRAPPFVDRIEIEWIAEPGARWASFAKDSEVQYTVLPPDYYDAVLATREPVTLKPEFAARYHHRAATETALVFLAFNFNDPDLGHGPDAAGAARNRELRCAIVQGFDWHALRQRFYGGLGSLQPGVLLPQLPEFDAAAPPPLADPAAARARLERAGFTAQNLPVIEESALGTPLYREMHEQFRGFLTALGWPGDKVRLRSYAGFADLERALRTGKAQVFLRGSQLDYFDAAAAFQMFYGPNASPGDNTSNYRNAAFDALYERASAMAPGEARTALYRQMNQLLVDDCAGAFSLARTRVHLWQRRVRALPDREIGHGFWLRYVDVEAPARSAAP